MLCQIFKPYGSIFKQKVTCLVPSLFPRPFSVNFIHHRWLPQPPIIFRCFSGLLLGLFLRA